MGKYELIPNIVIRSYSPSQIVELGKSHPEIADHIIAGYNIPENSTQSKEQIIADEYDHGEERTLIFLAEIDGKVVGSMYFILWINNENDKRGSKFLEFLQNNADDLIDLEELKKIPILACDIGIVVHPDYRGRGVVTHLYTTGVQLVRPAFIVGQTKTPAAVIARNRVLGANGYLSSYGGLPISSNLKDETAGCIANAYYFARQDVAQRVGNTYTHYAKTEALQPEIEVNLSKLEHNIKVTFEAIMIADTDRPEGYITFSPLVSVSRHVLKSN